MASKNGTSVVSSQLNQQFNGAAYTPPSTIYVALLTTAATDYGTGVGSVEVTGGGYVRTAVVANVTNFPTTATRSIGNGTVVNFVTPTASQGTAVGFGYYSAVTGGTWQGGGDLATNQVLSTGNTVSFAIGALTISLP